MKFLEEVVEILQKMGLLAGKTQVGKSKETQIGVATENERLYWLTELSKNNDPNKRMKAALMLGKVRDNSLLPFREILKSALDVETEPAVCIQLCQLLGYLKDEQATTCLLDFFEAIPTKGWSLYEQNLIKVSLNRVLGNSKDKRAIPLLRQEVEEGPDEETFRGHTSKGEAIGALSSLKDSAFADKVIPLINHNSYDVRINAVIYLSKFKDTEVLAILQAFFEKITTTQENPKIIIYTAFTLVRAGNLNAFDSLLKILATGTIDERKLLLLLFLEEVPTQDEKLIENLLQTVGQLLQAEDLYSEVAFITLHFLMKFKHSANNSLLIKFLSRKKNQRWAADIRTDLRAVAIKALGVLGGESEAKFLRNLREKNKYVPKSYMLQMYSADFGTGEKINLALEVKKALELIESKTSPASSR